jgi:hypothetical protein
MVLETGNLYGTVTDDEGAEMPGVTVILTDGKMQPQYQVTKAHGEFQFLGLPPGRYNVDAQLEGYEPVEYPNIHILIARNTNIMIILLPVIE